MEEVVKVCYTSYSFLKLLSAILFHMQMLMSAFFSITIVMKVLLVLIPMEAFHVVAMKDSMALGKPALVSKC